MKKSLCLLLTAALASTAALAQPSLSEVVASEFRQPDNVKRDLYRHPAETLNFLGLQPDQTVIELWPGGSAWYAEIIAPYLASSGHYVAANFNVNKPESEKGARFYRDAGLKFSQWLASNRDKLGNRASEVVLDPPAHLTLGPDASADMVLTFRNLHNWASNGQLDAVFGAAFAVLKPGGILGVVEHRAAPGMTIESGYMDETQMIAAAQQAGFVLEAKSEINANPKDTKDYEKGVWTLPPRLALGEQDKARYLGIGESDRMTLKFVKKAD
ncbi:class I SAM-dependent methyltransferase [Shewanella sp. GXUN23E]|uniref:class I SAM-dependent methyltransferase n=1 Tax=Shewanella sp. GXUN23E TaxID=3422498 RepID=UPI003D7F0CE2